MEHLRESGKGHKDWADVTWDVGTDGVNTVRNDSREIVLCNVAVVQGVVVEIPERERERGGGGGGVHNIAGHKREIIIGREGKNLRGEYILYDMRGTKGRL